MVILNESVCVCYVWIFLLLVIQMLAYDVVIFTKYEPLLSQARVYVSVAVCQYPINPTNSTHTPNSYMRNQCVAMS